MPAPGEMIGGRYRLDDRIAAGGMGEVWRATDTVLGRDVAVKTLHAGQAGDPGFQERFRHEARAMAALHHPGIADVYDYGQTGDGADAYIVMARVAGRPLNELIAARERLGPAETMSIVAQAGRALDAAHQAGIVHRDVKPGNLIIRPDGTVVLVDFGVARSTESVALTGLQEVVGTALYIAPEQLSKRGVGPATDLYALGAVAYHCVAGRPPFTGDNPVAVAVHHLNDEPPPLPPDVPEPVNRLITTAMAKQPERRYPSAAAMAAAAEAATVAEPFVGAVTAPLVGAATAPPAAAVADTRGFDPVPAPARRRPVVPWALGVLVAVVAGVAVWLGTSGSDLPGPGVSPSSTGTAPGDSRVGTAPAGGNGGGGGAADIKTTGGPSTVTTPSRPAAGGAATPTTGSGGGGGEGGATPTSGGEATTDPEPEPTATTAVEKTTAPAAAASGAAG